MKCITCGYWVATVGDQCEACGGDQRVDLQGPMFCEEHPQTIWPHGDCRGPGVWYTNGNLKVLSIIAPQSIRDIVDSLPAASVGFDSLSERCAWGDLSGENPDDQRDAAYWQGYEDGRHSVRLALEGLKS